VLSPRLAELAKPSVRAAPPAEQAHELGVAAEGPGSLLRDGNRVLVDVRFDHGAAAGTAALRATGAKVVSVSGRYQTVTVAAKPDQLRRLSGVAGVAAAKEVLTPVAYAANPPSPVASAVTPCFGAATSEGDEQLRAAEAREQFGVDGSGVTVGILSDSFNADEFADTTAGNDVKSGDLPGKENPCGHSTPVEVVKEIEDPEEAADEGRAMAQIVHDLAPGAKLAFASAFNGEIQFAKNIEALAKPSAEGGAEARVIADDVFYFEEPFFQDGPVGVAVNGVREEGVSYFSAAGNDNLVNAGRDIASWEAPQFRDSLGCPPSLVQLSEELEAEGEPGLKAEHCMDFNPDAGTDQTFGITVEAGATLIVDLQWAEPWEGVGSDLDAYLLDSKGVPISSSADDNIASQRPFELLGWENETSAPVNVQLVINRYSGDDPLLKFGLLENGSGVSATEYETSNLGDTVGPTIFGHSGSAGAVSVGAVPYFSDSEPEEYSSRGPVTHYFGPVESSPKPAPKLGSPEKLAKPDVVATDGGADTFFGSCVGHVWRFFGTSAAAPHAAAVAALELDAKPSADANEVIEAQEETARAVGTFPAEAVGSGLVDAVGAVADVLGTTGGVEPVAGPETTPPDCSPPKPPIEEVEEKIIAANPPAATPPPTKGRIPSTFFRRHPRRLIRTPGRGVAAIFRFGSDQAGITFFCRVDGGFLRVCPERFVRRYATGPHVLRVMARNVEGNIDSTPAVFHFKVERSD
jgi:subtilisin family serine protease